MKCSKCGFIYNYDSNICPQCGNIITDSQKITSENFKDISLTEPIDNIEEFGATMPVENIEEPKPSDESAKAYDPITQLQKDYTYKKSEANSSPNKKSPVHFIAFGILLVVIAAIIIVFFIKDEKKGKNDNGNSFKIEQKLLVVNESLFGMSYDELNDYLDGTLPSLKSWDWADVPLDYCDFTYTDNNSYTLFFENKKLVGIRYEVPLNGEEIPSDVYNAAVNKYGVPYKNWVSEGHGEIYEYNWKCKINGQNGEYAIFVNFYDNVYHLDQQYTSADYTGDYIQPHTMY